MPLSARVECETLNASKLGHLDFCEIPQQNTLTIIQRKTSKVIKTPWPIFNKQNHNNKNTFIITQWIIFISPSLRCLENPPLPPKEFPKKGDTTYFDDDDGDDGIGDDDHDDNHYNDYDDIQVPGRW